ncbi:unnamed protein product [Cyclocybe aegerita]|uniref:Uncharacterized protein n=1 Tax=Cyclocybe aegerita TaxID=1973307 RepID=A0A8S0WY37_CYCAE|nr:unnamed protein product [Cyclocybe aegerita]
MLFTPFRCPLTSPLLCSKLGLVRNPNSTLSPFSAFLETSRQPDCAVKQGVSTQDLSKAGLVSTPTRPYFYSDCIGSGWVFQAVQFRNRAKHDQLMDCLIRRSSIFPGASDVRVIGSSITSIYVGTPAPSQGIFSVLNSSAPSDFQISDLSSPSLQSPARNGSGSLNTPATSLLTGNGSGSATRQGFPMRLGPQRDPDSPWTSYDQLSSARRTWFQIYHQQITAKVARGFPLGIPGPNEFSPLEHRRMGAEIGDVGVFTQEGAFLFFFNILYPRDHLYNPPNLPDDFRPLEPGFSDVSGDYAGYSDHFHGRKFVASRSVAESSTAGDSKEILFILDRHSDSAILAIPEPVDSKDLVNVARLEQFVSENAKAWYNYVTDTRGYPCLNGHLHVITGREKTTAWGMAVAEGSPNYTTGGEFQLSFNRGSDRTSYHWDCHNGCAEFKTGPSRDEVERLREMDPSENKPDKYKNQCLFVRTLCVTLSEDAWNRRGRHDSEGEGGSDESHESSGRSSPEDDASGPKGTGRNGGMGLLRRSILSRFFGEKSRDYGGSDCASLQTSTVENPPSSVAIENQRRPLPSSLDQVSIVVMPLLPMNFPFLEVDTDEENLTVAHPLQYINAQLARRIPGCKVIVTGHWLWERLLNGDDETMPSNEELFRRVCDNYVVVHKDGSSYRSLPLTPDYSLNEIPQTQFS